jgi:anti-sigma regulatory factor (Ser/Thr protein kinase)
LATLVGGVRILAGMPESVRAARAWIAECLSGSPAADDAALMVSELFTNAILYTRSGQPGGVVTVTIAIGRGRARIHVIDQGAHLERIDAGQVAAIIAVAPRFGGGLTIVRELADEFTAEGPDKCFTLRVAGAGPVRSSPPGGPGESEPEAKR